MAAGPGRRCAGRPGQLRGRPATDLRDAQIARLRQEKAQLEQELAKARFVVANGITTVHLAYVREGTGHALIAARQWIPREQIDDPARRQIMKVPPDLTFRTKGQLAIDLIGGVLADGIRLDFACGDEVYGNCTQLRKYLESRALAYVLRVSSNFCLTVARCVRLTCKQAAVTLAGARRGWEVRSAGHGAKGQRWYAWAWLSTASSRHHLLIRRHLATGELAFHYCFVPDGQPVSLSRLVRAAGCRWPDRQPPAERGMMPLSVPDTAPPARLSVPTGADPRWLAWRRRHQALST